MEKTNKNSIEEVKRMPYADNREYQAKFLLDPDINTEEDFAHFDKNLAITNLKHDPRTKINEVEECRSILRGLHILNNKKHYHEVEVQVLTGYERVEKDGKIFLVPVYRTNKVKQSNFPKTFHSIKSEFMSLINTTAARNGHRMKAAITNRLEKIESLQDRTKAKNKWGFNNKNY